MSNNGKQLNDTTLRETKQDEQTALLGQIDADTSKIPSDPSTVTKQDEIITKMSADPSTATLQTTANGILTTIDVDTNNISTYTNQGRDFYLEVAKGKIPGHSAVNKFGHNITAGAGDDIWGGDGVYGFYPTAAVAVDIVSTAGTDATGGSGAIQVKVQGLDSNWELREETVTAMAGATPVQLNNSFVRLFRAWVYEAGANNTNDGVITVYPRANGSGVTTSDVGIHIGVGEGQTQQGIYTVPAGKTAYFIKGYVGLATATKTAENGTFQWLLKENNGVNGAWRVQGEVGLVNLGSGHWQYEYGIPAGPLPEKTDIRLRMSQATAQFIAVCGFDLLLVDD